MDVKETGERLANLSISGSCPNPEDVKPTRVRLPSGQEQDVSQSDQSRFNKLVTKGKQLASEGRIREALELNKKALKIYQSEKLAKRIAKMEAYLQEYEENEESEEDDSGGMIHLGNGFYLFKELHDKLYAHQKVGVLWLWDIYRKNKGGILGDDMGLGKTIQVISFLSGMFDADKVKTVLVVLPVSLMSVWERELEKWAPGIRVIGYHGTSKRERERGLAKIQRRGGVCLTTYGLVVSSWDKLSEEDGREFTWDYIILDEGHKIKNPTKTSKGVRAIGAKHRIILTGTPVQNNLKEMWSLFDFVHHGALLGTSRTFKMEYETPITRARERDATAGEKRLGLEMAESLKRIISPYFLRRTKAEVTANDGEKENEDPDVKGSCSNKQLEMPSLTRKNDFIIWLFLTDAQKKIYEDFISLDDVKELLNTSKSPLVALTVLKKLCDHLRLLSTRACIQLGLAADEKFNVDDLDTDQGLQCAANRIQYIPDEVLINESGKLIFLVELLDNLKSEGHRCLVFSQSTKMLNIIQKIITNRGHKIMRLDGSVTQVSERQERINKFQKDRSYSVFLLTTQVGGVGLTLTSADRVVIYDPSWNPATDAQAVDRVFRIGQDKNVVIYRLITCGTVEEKIYRRQVFKDSITRQTTGSTKNPYRYFTKQELRELFILDNAHFSTTQKQLEEMHGGHRSSDTKLDAHIAFLHSLDIFGISDHDLMFNVDHDDETDCMDEGIDYIQSRVEKAQQLLTMESNMNSDMRAQMEKYPRSIDVDPSLKATKPAIPRNRTPQLRTPATNQVIDLRSPSPRSEVNVKNDGGQRNVENDPLMFQNLSEDEDQANSSADSSPNNDSKNTESVSIEQDDIKAESLFPEVHTDFQSDVQNDYMDVNTAEPDLDNKINIQQNLCDIETIPKPDCAPQSSEIDQKPCTIDGTPQSQINDNPLLQDSPVAVQNESTHALTATPTATAKVKRTPKLVNGTPGSASRTPISVNRIPMSVNGTPQSIHRTPKSMNRSFQHLIKEEITISPDASRPIIKMEPVSPGHRQPPCPPRRFRHNSSDPIRCVLEPDEIVDKSPVRNSALYTTLVQDSPDVTELQIHRPYQNKRLSRLSVGHPKAFTVVMDSVENSPADNVTSVDSSPNIVSMVGESDQEVIEDSSPEDIDVSSIRDENSKQNNSSLTNFSSRHSGTPSTVNLISGDGSGQTAEIPSGLNGEEAEKACPSHQSNAGSESDVSSSSSPVPQKPKGRKSLGGRRQSGRVPLPKRLSGKGGLQENEEASGYDSTRSDSEGEIQNRKSSTKGRLRVLSSEDEDDDDDGDADEAEDDDGDDDDDGDGDEDDDGDEDVKSKPAGVRSGSNLGGKSRRVESESGEEEESVEESIEEDEESGDSEGGSFIDDEEVSDAEDLSEEGSDLEEGMSEEEVPEEILIEFENLEAKALKLYKAGRYKEALVPTLQALEIYADPRLQALALKIHKKMKSK